MSADFFLKFILIALAISLIVYLASLADMLTQLSRYKNYWDRNNKEAASSGKSMDYVAFGDSAAQGVGATHPSKGYVGLLSELLEKRDGKKPVTVNLSKSGARVRDVLDIQLPEYEKLKTGKNTLVTIEIGANDMINFNENSFREDVDSLMSRLPKNTLMTDVPYFGGTRFKSKQPDVEKANKIMHDLAKKHGLELIPLHDKVKGNSGLKTMAPDLFHPSNAAYRENWSAVFASRIGLSK